MPHKLVDKKGRLALGPEFANRLVMIDDSDQTHVVITPAEVVPAHEVWLYKNEAAMKSLLTGMQQAKDARYSTNPPDLDSYEVDESED
jgi:hypothetical protein